jgi:hypothetical protein
MTQGRKGRIPIPRILQTVSIPPQDRSPGRNIPRFQDNQVILYFLGPAIEADDSPRRILNWNLEEEVRDLLGRPIPFSDKLVEHLRDERQKGRSIIDVW